jgi:DNA polymerase-3 subunit epsilon
MLLQASFDELSTPLYEVTFCVVDLETTGGSPAQCEITEIGAVKHRGGDLLGSFQTLVDPGGPIPPFITVLTGITHAMVLQAPRLEAVLPAFLEFLGDSVIVGHNIRFDMSFLNAAASRLGYPRPDNPTVDTARLARRLVRTEVRNLRLATLAAHFRSPVTPVHRALEDARATAHVFHGLLERAGSLGVTNLDDLLAMPTARGSAHYSKIRLTDGLPRRPGVYLLNDRKGSPIYVGKATNLRARVRQYFYGDERRSIADLMRELHGIDYVECASLLEAEVTELRLIHAHRPRYNRRSRPPKTSHFVKLTKEAFPRLSVVRTLRDDGLAHLGPFRSKRAADQVVAAIWDATSLRRCRGRPGSRTSLCAPAQMGLALCPCDGSLPHQRYREVVDQVIQGFGHRPQLLLDGLIRRMERLADERRYEEAGLVRDRHRGLARALETRHHWQTLVSAGMVELEHQDGHRLVIDCGRLSETSIATIAQRPVDPADVSPATSEVPPSVEAAEEANLLWRWLASGSLRLLDATGPLSSPARQISHLAVGRAA